MPQPPLLPIIDWRQLFAAGLAWSEWLDTAQKAEQRAELQASYDSFQPQPETVRQLNALRKPVHIIAIAEAWCGDVRRHVPVLQKLAAAGVAIEIRYITRQQRLDIFARLLTNGGEAIPKAVFLSADFVETGNWGPMPENGRRLIAQGKAANDLLDARVLVKGLYASDPGRRAAENEILDRITIAATEQVGTTLSSASV